MTDEIVDPTGGRQLRRRLILSRFAVPFLGVGSVIVAILAITFHSYEVNRAGALTLSRELLTTLQAYVGEQVAAYLEPATRAALIAQDMIEHTDPAERQTAFTSYAASMLRGVPQIEAFYLANASGQFAAFSRASNGGTASAVMRDPATHTVQTEQRDAQGHVVHQAAHPAPGYDPRSRPWFSGAVAALGKMVWSPPTLFTPTDTLVVTVSIARRASDGTAHVDAVDVALDDLSQFVAGLKIGHDGHAAIVDRDGHLIAAPELAGAPRRPTRALLDQAHDPVLTRAWDRFRVEGLGARAMTVGKREYVSIAARLPAGAPDWVLLIAAPQSDFAGFAAAAGRQNLLFSLVIVTLVLVLAVLLIRQSMRVDRARARLAAQRDLGREESRALGALVANSGLFDPEHDAPLLTERLAALASARRASIWHLSRDERALACDDAYDRITGAHGGGFELSRTELPRFFETILRAEPVDIADAARDPRAAELHRLVMREAGSTAISMIPIDGPTGVAGAVLVEDPTSLDRARNFAGAVAGIAAIRLRASGGTDEAAGRADDEATQVQDEAEAASDPGTDLVAGPGEDQPSGSGLFPAAAVMVLLFSDPFTQTRRDPAAFLGIADEIARAVQQIASHHDIPYLKLVNHRLVAAAGCTPTEDKSAAIRLAEAALAARDACIEALARAELEPVFQIGLDVGRAIGSRLGDTPSVFNLWGDVVRMAELMATTAPDPGTIQVTEAATLLLRDRFLFRSRGSFYMPRVGVARSFVLAGRR